MIIKIIVFGLGLTFSIDFVTGFIEAIVNKTDVSRYTVICSSISIICWISLYAMTLI